MVDTFMGQALVDALLPPGGSDQIVREEEDLFGKGRKSQTSMTGKIIFEYRTTTDLSEF